MVGIRHQDRARLAPLGGVNKPSLGPGVLAQTLHGRGGGTDDAHHPAGQHIVAEADIDQMIAAHKTYSRF